MPRPMKRVRPTTAEEPAKSKAPAAKRKRKEKAEDKTYQVEALLDSKKEGKTQQFLVKWVGYTEPTWEPRANILDIQLIKDYEKMVKFTKWRAVTKKLKQSKLDKNVKIEQIIDSREEDGVTELLIKFANSSDLEVHRSEKVAEKNAAVVKKYLGKSK